MKYTASGLRGRLGCLRSPVCVIDFVFVYGIRRTVYVYFNIYRNCTPVTIVFEQCIESTQVQVASGGFVLQLSNSLGALKDTNNSKPRDDKQITRLTAVHFSVISISDMCKS